MKTKKKSGKRFLSWLLAAVMIIALMPATAFAEPPTESSGNTEPAVTSYCPSSEGGTDVSVGEYDSSPAAETKDTPTAEPVKDTPTAEPAKDTPTEEPAKDTPAAEPVKESPVADKTTEGAPAQGGAVENSTDEKITEDLTNEVSAAELAGLAGMFAAPVLLNLQADTSPYPIYVYGYFVNGKDEKGEDNILSGKKIKIQKDGKSAKSVRWNDYYPLTSIPRDHYITFGKIEKGTTVEPKKLNQKESIPDDALEMLTASLGDSTDMQNQYFSWKDVAIDDWDLHVSSGATDYPDEDGKYTWHMDGKIHTYKIKYMNGTSDVSKDANVDKNTYYCGEYTIDTYKPNAPKGKVFAGWTVNGSAKADGTYYQGGDTITLKDHDTDNTGKITLEAQWEDLPVYVYGCFKHKNANGTAENLGSNAALYVNNKKVDWNPDNTKGEYYITFGKLANATTDDPSDYSSDEESAGISTAEIVKQINDGKVVLSNDTGSAKANGLLKNNASTDIPTLVHAWSGLKSRNGAASYAEETADKQTWHLDGTIYLYKVKYEKGEITENVNLPKETTYFLGNYTVNNQEPTSNTHNFIGWKLENEDGSLSADTYTKGNLIPNSEKDITLVAQWEDKENVYTVNYTWDDNIPANVKDKLPKLPADPTEYPTEEAARESSKNHSSFEPVVANNGTYTFSGWTPTVGTPNYSGDKIVTPITFKGTWTFKAKPITTTYRVVYEWGGENIPNVTVPASENFTSEQDALNSKDKHTYQPFQTNDGIYTFNGWGEPEIVPNNETHVTTITYTGTWSFTKTLTLTFMIRGGTWNGTAGNNAPIVNSGCVPGEDGYCFMPDGTELPTGMVADSDHIEGSGKWYRLDGTDEILVKNISNEKFNVDTTYIFVFAPKSEVQPDTILDVLNKKVTIEKFFKSQYGYSTEGTFTATAKVMPYRLEISSYTDGVDVSSDNNTNIPGTDKPKTKTFTGTVTLKTGETNAFTFSAKEAADNVLEPRTHYAVWISEEKGDLSKVTYDTTKYFLEFATGENSEVLSNSISIHIWTGEDIAEGDGKEQEPVKVDKITFQNIYTYTRRHSSGDDGNGGGKKEEKPTVEIKDDDALGLNNTDHFAYIVGYGNGEVRPQNSITRAEVAAIFFRLLEDDVRDANYTRQNKFTDVSNDAWYCSAVSTLSAMGIISGYPDATFRPNASITRAEFAAIATRFDVNGDKTPASFNDIADHWAKDEIAVAANNGWVNGYEDGSFRPQNKITRAETMSLVNRVLNRRPETAEDLLENMTKWTDNADTNAWYYLAVQEATNSHYYEYKENSQYEKWTELRETRDWSELDK